MANIFDRLNPTNGGVKTARKPNIFDRLNPSGIPRKVATGIPAGLHVSDDYILTGTPTTEGEYIGSEGGIGSVKSERGQRKSPYQALRDGLQIAGLRMAEQLGGWVRLAGESLPWKDRPSAGLRNLYASMEDVPVDIYRPETGKTLKIPTRTERAKRITTWGKETARGATEYLRMHPELQQTIEPGTGFWGTLKQYVTKPENIIQGVAETVPLLMEAYLGHVTGTAVAKHLGKAKRFLPWLGRVQGIALPIIGSEYHEAREQGTPPGLALSQAMLIGQGEAIVEEFSIGRKIGIYKQFRKELGRATGKYLLVKGTIGAGKVFARGTAEEMTQEVNRNFWNMVFSNPDQKILENIMEVGATGGVLELAMAGGFATAGKVGNIVNNKEKKTRVEAVRKIVSSEETGLSPEAKEEVNKVLDDVIEGIEKPIEAKIKPVEVKKPPIVKPVEKEYIYHGTSEGAFRKIREQGMKGKLKYFSKEEQYAQTYADRKGTGERILRIKRTADIVPDKEIIDGDFKTSRDISPREIEVKVGGKWIPVQEYVDEEINIMAIKKPVIKKKAPDFYDEHLRHVKEGTDIVGTPAETSSGIAEDFGSKMTSEQRDFLVERSKSQDVIGAKLRKQAEEEMNAGKEGWEKIQNKAQVEDLRAALDREAIRAYDEKQVEKSAEKPKLGAPPGLSAEMARKKRILATTGVKKPEIPVLTTEMSLLKAKLKAEHKGAIKGERIGRVETRKKIYTDLRSKKTDVKIIQKNILDYAKEQLTKTDRDRIGMILSRAKTKKNLARAFQMIDGMEERYQRHVAVDDLKKTVKGIDFKKLRPEYKIDIETIANSIDLIKRREKTITSLNKLVDYITRNPEHTIPEHHLTRLSLLSKTPIKDANTEDLKLINDSIKHLVKLHDLKNKILFGRKIRDFVELRDQAVGNIEHKPEPEDIDPRRGIEALSLKRVFTSDSVNAEFICRMFDRSDDGVIKKVIYDNIDDGITKILRIRQQADDYFTKAAQGINTTRWSESFHIGKKRQKKNVDYHEYKLDSGQKIRITKGERIALELHSKSQANLRHILEGGIRLSTNPAILYKITGDDLTNIKDSMSSEESRIADSIHRYLNTTQTEKINEVSTRLNGWDIATESDYFPIRIHSLDVPRSYLQKGEVLPSNMRKFMQSTLEGMGILKERVKGKNPLILEDAFVATYKSVKQTSTYCGLAEPLRSAKAFLFDGKFRTSILRRYRPGYWQGLENHIADIEGQYQRIDNIDKILVGTINKLDIAVLGANPWVAAKQRISYVCALLEIKFKYWQKALVHSAATAEEMGGYSSQLRDRYEGNVTRELGEIAGYGQVRNFWTHKRAISHKLMWLIRHNDKWAVGRIWNAIKYEVEELHPELKGKDKQEYIVRRTEEVVRLTQPTFHPKDRSSIGRSQNTFVRLATKYTSQRNKNYMMIGRTVLRYNQSKKSIKDKTRLLRDIALVLLPTTLMLYLIDELRNRLYKRRRPDKLGKYRLLKFLEYVAGNVYFVGPIFRSIASKIERGTFAGYDPSDVLTSTIGTGIDAIVESEEAIEEAITKERYKAGPKKSESKWKTSAMRAIDKAISVTSKLRGMPYDTVKQLLISPFKTEEKPKVKKRRTAKQVIESRKRKIRRAMKRGK